MFSWLLTRHLEIWRIHLYLFVSFRRKLARERQQKLLAEFASKQKTFMEKNMPKDAGIVLRMIADVSNNLGRLKWKRIATTSPFPPNFNNGKMTGIIFPMNSPAGWLFSESTLPPSGSQRCIPECASYMVGCLLCPEIMLFSLLDYYNYYHHYN